MALNPGFALESFGSTLRISGDWVPPPEDLSFLARDEVQVSGFSESSPGLSLPVVNGDHTVLRTQ